MSAQDLTEALGGHWHGSYGLARCPAHQDRTPSLSIRDGNNGKLLLYCFAGCRFVEVTEALRLRGLVNGNASAVRDPVEDAKRQAKDRAADERKARIARQLWDNALPIRGTLAETYLRSRGMNEVPDMSLRFDPVCWHSQTAQRLPAMIARVGGVKSFAVHRTYLRPDGKWKADVSPEKAMLGQCRGGAVYFGGAPRAPLIVAEGIETALSCRLIFGRPARTLGGAVGAGDGGPRAATGTRRPDCRNGRRTDRPKGRSRSRIPRPVQRMAGVHSRRAGGQGLERSADAGGDGVKLEPNPFLQEHDPGRQSDFSRWRTSTVGPSRFVSGTFPT